MLRCALCFKGMLVITLLTNDLVSEFYSVSLCMQSEVKLSDKEEMSESSRKSILEILKQNLVLES